MDKIAFILTGGFLSGYRTYIAGGILMLTAIGQYATGELTLTQFLDQLPHLAEGLGFVALRAGIKNEAK